MVHDGKRAESEDSCPHVHLILKMTAFRNTECKTTVQPFANLEGKVVAQCLSARVKLVQMYWATFILKRRSYVHSHWLIIIGGQPRESFGYWCLHINVCGIVILVPNC